MASYTLLYHATIPGRGEFVRLLFEAAQAPYTDDTSKQVYGLTGVNAGAAAGHPAHFACPLLKVELGSGDSSSKSRKTESGQDAKIAPAESTSSSSSSSSSSATFYISQTPVILAYLAPKLGLDGTKDEDLSPDEAEIRRSHVNQLVSTILDLNNEVHDAHHPISVAKYYEEQKEAASARTEDLRNSRIPKFLSIFELSIKKNPAASGFLISKHPTAADLALWQTIEGLTFSFPNLVKSLRQSGKYDGVFKLHEQVSDLPGIKAYTGSNRRRQFGNGIYRHYPELDPDV